MKRSVYGLLDGVTAAELDTAAADLAAGLPDGAGERITALAAEKAGVRQKNRRNLSRILAIAACMAVFMGALAGCYAVDEAQYRRAAEFFDLNHLSTEGLDRSQIKRVYRDITTESLSYDKSLEVLAQNSRIDTSAEPKSIAGVDISILNSTNSVNVLPHNAVYDLNSGSYRDAVDENGDGLYFMSFARAAAPAEGLYYLLDCKEGDESVWYRSTSVEKYVDGESLWRTELSQAFYPERCLDAGDLIYVWGHNGSGSHQYDRMAALDAESGEALWEKSLGSNDYGISAALTQQGEIAVFSCENSAHQLIFRVIDRGGRVIKECQSDLPAGMINVGKAITVKDGYLVEAWYSGDREQSDSRSRLRLMKLSADGEPVQTIRYGDESYSYDLSDMTEHNGKIILSATARPTDSRLYRDGDLSSVSADAFGRFTEEWRDRAREEFSAVLFVIAPDSGEPERFYTVDGAFAGGLGTDAEGNLTWNAERILTCAYSPFTSAFSIYGNTRRYIYTLDSAADRLRQERTDLLGGFTDH